MQPKLSLIIDIISLITVCSIKKSEIKEINQKITLRKYGTNINVKYFMLAINNNIFSDF